MYNGECAIIYTLLPLWEYSSKWNVSVQKREGPCIQKTWLGLCLQHKSPWFVTIVCMTNVFDSSFPWTELVKVILLSLEFPRLKSKLFAILNATCTTCFQSLWSKKSGSQASRNHGNYSVMLSTCLPWAGDLVLLITRMTSYINRGHEGIT